MKGYQPKNNKLETSNINKNFMSLELGVKQSHDEECECEECLKGGDKNE